MEPPPSPLTPLRAPPSLEPLEEIVPPRAVLTELARGFLLLHDRDPGRASEFARTFLRERAGHATPGRERPRLPAVRRGSSVWGADDLGL